MEEFEKGDDGQFLILVDERDQSWGKLEKMEVHRLGLLHRAFSVFIFNTRGELLLQQRAENKYHSGNLWSNTCCSHPQYGEELKEAVDRRLWEEVGLKAETEFAFSFIYKIKFSNGLTEHEFDHVFFGVTDDIPTPDRREIKSLKFFKINELDKDLDQHPQNYTEWLKLCFPKILRDEKIKKIINNHSPDPGNQEIRRPGL